MTEDVLAGPGEEIPEDSIGDVLVDLTEETEEEIDVLKGMRCIQQYAINVVRTVKFLSSQLKASLFTVMIVLKTKAGKLVQDLNQGSLTSPEKSLTS